MEAPPINQEQTEEVLQWIDTIPFSRSAKNISRDFSDGVLIAEIIKYNLPNLVQLHNYQPANSSSAKYVNWKTLNQKIFRKIGFQVHKNDIQKVISSSAGAIQKVLYLIYSKIQNYHPQQTQLKDESIIKDRNLKMMTETMDYARQLSTQLAEKQIVIKELRQTIEILQTKMKKMEQLNKLKDAKIDSLMRKLDENVGI